MSNGIHKEPEGGHPGSIWAAKFIEFVGSETGQGIIRDFGKDRYGEGH